jgi:hypothetical protein
MDMEKRKILGCIEPSAFQPVGSRYTDDVLQAPALIIRRIILTLTTVNSIYELPVEK